MMYQIKDQILVKTSLPINTLNKHSFVAKTSGCPPLPSHPRHLMPLFFPLPRRERAGVRGVVIPSVARNLVVLFRSYKAASNAALSRAPAGAAAPRSRIQYRGEDCLSEASSAAQTIGTVAKAPEGPRPGAPGFGSFCRNKRTASCGAATPQSPPSPRRRAGPKPRKKAPPSSPRHQYRFHPRRWCTCYVMSLASGFSP